MSRRSFIAGVVASLRGPKRPPVQSEPSGYHILNAQIYEFMSSNQIRRAWNEQPQFDEYEARPMILEPGIPVH